MWRFVVIGVVLGLMIYSLTDCVQTPDREIRVLPKIGWVFVILLLPIAGGAGWLVAGRPARPGIQDRRPGSPGPRGPDDDPDFLRGL